MLNAFENWLVGRGRRRGHRRAMAATATGVLVVVALAVIANFVAKRVMLRAVVKLAKRTATNWDDVLTERRVFHRLAHIAPALVIYVFAPAVLGASHSSSRSKCWMVSKQFDRSASDRRPHSSGTDVSSTWSSSSWRCSTGC